MCYVSSDYPDEVSSTTFGVWLGTQVSLSRFSGEICDYKVLHLAQVKILLGKFSVFQL